MSEHEGFCVPLAEAMAFQIPIVAYDSSAIGWTLGGSGILLKDKNLLEAAGMIHQVMTRPGLKEDIVANENIRLGDFSHDVIRDQFVQYLNGFTGRENEKDWVN